MAVQTEVFRPSLGAKCFPDLPSPRLVITGSEHYTVRGQEFTRFLLGVQNSPKFPDALFSVAPNLPPCGLNNKSSRSWVQILDENNRGIYGFCGLKSSEQLNSTWFAIPRGQAPPKFVYITIQDRQCGFTYKSNLVPVRP
jgi:hypothetical protein